MALTGSPWGGPKSPAAEPPVSLSVLELEVLDANPTIPNINAAEINATKGLVLIAPSLLFLVNLMCALWNE